MSKDWKQGRTRHKIRKNMICLHKIVIFHMKYPKNFRTSLRLARFFKVCPPNLKSWIRPWERQNDLEVGE